jgi:hypothetical protein
MLGQGRDCAEALGAAEDSFASVGPQDPASALYCPSHHARLAGSCWLSLNRSADAITALEKAHQLVAARRKSTAVVLGNLALANLRHRDLDTAFSYLHQAISVIERTREGAAPPGVHGHIPDFAGKEDAAARLAYLEIWKQARVIKCNPDRAQLPVRVRALQEGKLLYMAVPRLATPKASTCSTRRC